MNKKNSSGLVLVIAIIAFSPFYWICTENGMNYTADSNHYLNVAQQIYQNGFISMWKNKKLVNWPPLYPLVLSFIVEPNNPDLLRILHYSFAILIIVIWNYISGEIFQERGKQLLL